MRREDFHAVIDGMEMDVVGDIRARRRDARPYCNRVASAVGGFGPRFGMEEHAGWRTIWAARCNSQHPATRRGRGVRTALLPAEALREAGSPRVDPAAVLASPALGSATASWRAHAPFHKPTRSWRGCPPVRAPRIMAEAYRLILDSLVARGWSHPRRPIHLPRSRLLWIIMRHAFI
jgi:phytoene synthase